MSETYLCFTLNFWSRFDFNFYTLIFVFKITSINMLWTAQNKTIIYHLCSPWISYSHSKRSNALLFFNWTTTIWSKRTTIFSVAVWIYIFFSDKVFTIKNMHTAIILKYLWKKHYYFLNFLSVNNFILRRNIFSNSA